MPPGLIIVSDLHNRAALLAVRQMLFSSALHELFSSVLHELFASALHELFASALHEPFASALHELFSSARHKLFSFIRLMYLITPFDNVPLAFRNISS